MKRTKLILIILTCLCAILILIYMSLAQSRQRTMQAPLIAILPTPTIIPTPFVSILADLPAPAQTMHDFTYTPTSTDIQYQTLLESLPLEQEAFSISYDFALLKFIVTLSPNSDEAAFYTWRKNMYPSLNDDDFIIKR